LQPGDMLFFKINSRTNHVGIYIGHGKFIHASSSKRRAIIDSMDRPYWKKRFVKFGSFLNS
jgi:cell wall-associated NlpC family hydrolase